MPASWGIMGSMKSRTSIRWLTLLFVLSAFLGGCAHKKSADHISRDDLTTKLVALADISGAEEAKLQVEVAIVNEIIDKGRFRIVDRGTVREALVTYPADSDWQRLGKKLGADFVFSIRIQEFHVVERQGYDRVQEEDSVLAEESGEPNKKVIGTRYVKVKSYEGSVKLSAMLFDVAEGAIIYQGTGLATDTVSSRDKDAPGKLKLLEKLSAKAITDFFERMPK